MEFGTIISTLGKIVSIYGLGSVSLIVLLGLFIYFILKLDPRLKSTEDSVRETALLTTEAIKNNTEALRTLQVSNDNVARALLTINSTMKVLRDVIISYTKKAEKLDDDVREVIVEVGKTQQEVSFMREELRHISNKRQGD